MANAYIFYGKAGSGKGTQAELLQKHLEASGRKIVYIETGELFREFVAGHDSFAAMRTKSVIDSGELMPAFFPIYLWSKMLIEKFDGTQDLILDGVTRLIEEAPILESALNFFQIDKKLVFNIHISDETAQARLVLRHEGRADDADSEKIQKRLDWYSNNVVPVLEYYRKGSTVSVHDVDGEPAVEDVFASIKQHLG